MQIIIQHHPSRNRHLSLLRVFLETTDSITIISDDISSASSCTKCYQAIEDDYALILQDDILPCKDLVKTCHKLIKLKPHSIISLFSANVVIEQALHRKRHFVKIDRLYGLCAYIIPRWIAKLYLEYEKDIKPNIRADDVRLSMLIKDKPNMIDAYLTAPSLVEHLGFFDSVQRVESGRIGRQNVIDYRIANYFIGFENSGLSIEWEQNINDPIICNIGQTYDYIRHKKNTSD